VRCSKSGIIALAYSQDGALLAAACADGDVHILRADNKVCRLIYAYCNYFIHKLAVSLCLQVLVA
jgi:Anaphase-promoting complex subunit 4 WD40 domain